MRLLKVGNSFEFVIKENAEAHKIFFESVKGGETTEELAASLASKTNSVWEYLLSLNL